MKYKLGDKVRIILGEHDGKVGFIDNIIEYTTDREPEYNIAFTNEDFTKTTFEEVQFDKDYIEHLEGEEQ